MRTNSSHQHAPRKKVPSRAGARERRLSPIRLMQLTTGYMAFGTLAAAVELDLFSKISGAGTNTGELMTVAGPALAPRRGPTQRLRQSRAPAKTRRSIPQHTACGRVLRPA